jgi:hypothetical protein
LLDVAMVFPLVGFRFVRRTALASLGAVLRRRARGVFAANRFDLRGKMRHGPDRVNNLKKSLNRLAGSRHQRTSRPT